VLPIAQSACFASLSLAAARVLPAALLIAALGCLDEGLPKSTVSCQPIAEESSTVTCSVTAVAGDIHEYLWDLGNGDSWDCGGSCSCENRCRTGEPAFTYTYTTPGRYRITVVVVDANLSTSTASATVHAGNKKPVACFNVPPRASAGEWVHFNALCSTDDESVQRYEFTFGDHTLPETQPVTQHQYSTAATYSPRLIVWDSDNVRSYEYWQEVIVGPKADQNPPYPVQITLPRPNDRVQRGFATELQALAMDDVEVYSVAYSLDDGKNFLGDSKVPPYTVRWTPPTDLSTGLHWIHATAFDTSNNSTDAKAVPVLVQ
jgi:hypothetical protein